MNPFSFDMMGPGSIVVLGVFAVIALLLVAGIAAASIIVLVILIRKKKKQNDADELKTLRQDPPKS